VARPAKKQEYQQHLHRMLDRILEIGRNEDGFLYNSINPQTGEHDADLADNWGYVLNAHYAVYLIDSVPAYRDAVLKALNSLSDPYYIDTHRFGEVSDGHADAIESALNLYHRELTHVSVPYLDVSTTRMWGMQQADGVIEGWHGDGNFARTTIMYCTWKTQGLSIAPWDSAVTFGAVHTNLSSGNNTIPADSSGNMLKIAMSSTKTWVGNLIFDTPRHKVNMGMPFDWTRINQFPEWYTVEADSSYLVENLTLGISAEYTGAQLASGITVILDPGLEQHLQVSPASKPGLFKPQGRIVRNHKRLGVSRARDQINFKVGGKDNVITHLSIYGLSGRQIMKFNSLPAREVTWDTRNQTKGTYLVHAVINGRETVVEKEVLW
jgi:hypothetical protein